MTPNDEGTWNDALFQEELGALYEKSYRRIVALVYRSTGMEDDAEDVVQAVFLRLMENPELYKDFRKNPEGYIYRAAINRMLKLIRNRKRHKIDDEDVSTFEFAEPQLDPIREQNILLVRTVLARMDPEKAELLNLFHVDELSWVAIGRLRGISVAAVAMQLVRARRAFEKLYRIEERKYGTQKADERLDQAGIA